MKLIVTVFYQIRNDPGLYVRVCGDSIETGLKEFATLVEDPTISAVKLACTNATQDADTYSLQTKVRDTKDYQGWVVLKEHDKKSDQTLIAEYIDANYSETANIFSDPKVPGVVFVMQAPVTDKLVVCGGRVEKRRLA